MRLLTFNAGLLDLRLFGRSLIKPADWITERSEKLASSILSLDADVVALQEVYAARHKHRLIADLRGRYPYAAVSPLRGPSIVPASLLTLSRWPIHSQMFHRFHDMPWSERLIDNKGFLITQIEGPFGEMIVANVHTTAGGTRHPEHAASDEMRARQLDELLQTVNPDFPVILAGDFNCGSVSKGNYRQLIDAGYGDAWQDNHPNDSGWTWDPTSPLNAGGTHSTWGCPAQRIDLVLLSRYAARGWRAVSCRRVFMEQDIRVAADRQVTLSDHYGVLAEMVAA